MQNYKILALCSNLFNAAAIWLGDDSTNYMPAIDQPNFYPGSGGASEFYGYRCVR